MSICIYHTKGFGGTPLLHLGYSLISTHVGLNLIPIEGKEIEQAAFGVSLSLF